MRLRHAKVIVAFLVIANLILFYYTWKSTLWKSLTSTLNSLELPQSNSYSLNGKSLAASNANRQSPYKREANASKHIRRSITIVFRAFYTFENDLKASIDSILDVIPNIQIVVLLEGVPYPPIIYERNFNDTLGNPTPVEVQFVSLGFDIEKTRRELDPLAAVSTPYVLFMPDSVRVTSKNLLQKVLRAMNAVRKEQEQQLTQKVGQQVANEVDVAPPLRHMIIVPFAGNIKSFCSCTQINLDLPNWTIQYEAVNESVKCDLYLQKHALLVDVRMLREMLEPFASPFPELFFIQAKMANITKTVFSLSFQDGRRLFTSYHTKQRRMETRRRQFKEMYKKLQIKRIVRRSHNILSKTDAKEGASSASGSHNLVLDTQFSSSNFSLPPLTEIDLIGCERTTKSCIGSVYNQRPFYLYLGKHTPPCCLDKLKSTINHVLEEFENVGIRYWLDNLALRTAIETNQLSPDAYEIDMSFNVNDLERSNALKKSQNKPYVDNEGFYWIKATDGHYFRVQFSKVNQIGVNLLPFEIKGNQALPNNFYGWKAKDFSADFLHPMSTVLFLGKNVMCPNNVREYLEYKKLAK